MKNAVTALLTLSLCTGLSVPALAQSAQLNDPSQQDPNAIQNQPVYSPGPSPWNAQNQQIYSPNPQWNAQNQQVYSPNPQWNAQNQQVYNQNPQWNAQNQQGYSPSPDQNASNQPALSDNSTNSHTDATTSIAKQPATPSKGLSPYEQQELALSEASQKQQLEDWKQQQDMNDVLKNAPGNSTSSGSPSKNRLLKGRALKNVFSRGMFGYGAPAAGMVGTIFLMRAIMR